MTDQHLPAHVIAISEEQAVGCQFCHAKAVDEARGTGKLYWRPATGCCAPSALLQAVWRKQDHDRAVRKLQRATDPRVRDDLAARVEELNEAYQDAVRTLRRTITTEDELEQAVRAAEAANYREDWRGIRAAFIASRDPRTGEK